MECARCHLDNMPGSAVCFQCQAELTAPADVSPKGTVVEERGGLARRAEDVSPKGTVVEERGGLARRAEDAAPSPYPARAAEKGLARGLRRQRAAPAVAPIVRRDPVLAPFRAEIDAALRSFVPGLGQWRHGERWKACAFFGAALVLLVAN